jgi:hypothetical protein
VTIEQLNSEAEFLFFLITNDPHLAHQAEQAGLERIGPDLEVLGKETRQKHPDARISWHTVEDVVRIRSVLKKSEVFVRINSIHSNSANEIERVLEAGAQIIMLPMFRTAEEVYHFISMVRGRAKTVLLLETPEAMMRIDEIMAVEGIGEVHIGLNDLHLGLKLHSRFEVLCSHLMDALAEAVRESNLPYGFGAVTRPNDLTLPIPPDQVIGEIVRLGASRASISQYFFHHGQEPFVFKEEICRIRERIAYWRTAGSEALLKNRQALRESVRKHREEHPTLNQL